jgi:hypothetical protein
MDINQLATWLESNQHKFIFYCYTGGSGGEFICNYLINHVDLFNKTANEYKNSYTQTESMDKFDNHSSVNNRSNFLDPLLYDSLSNSFQTSKELIQDDTPDHDSIDTFTTLAGMILTYIEREGWKLDESLLQAFANQDKKYLIRIHRMYPFMKLFNKSKNYVIRTDKWHQYTSLLVECKCLLAPYFTVSEKINALRLEHRLHNDHDIEKSISYIEPILNDDTIPLYQYTIEVMLNPSIFDIDITALTVTELQKMLWQLVVYRHLADKYREDIQENIAYIKTYYPDWLEEFNINLVSFEDVFLGNWVNKEFNLNKEDFYNSMVRWDQRNTIYLDKIDVKPKRGIKRLNQELYNDN